MKKTTKRNFRINIILIISAVVTSALLVACVFLDHQSNYLNGTYFSLNYSDHQKYRIELSSSFSNASGTIIPVSNYKEYQKVSKYYDFQNKSHLTKKDFKKSNYLYIITSESGCFDDYNFEYYMINGNRVDIYLSRTNCACLFSHSSSYVYEITFKEEITKDMSFNINYIDSNLTEITTCNLDK